MPPQPPPQPLHELQPLKVGDKVEIKMRRRSNGLGDSWFPATVCDLVDESTCGVVFGGEEAPGKTPETRQQVSRDRIRVADAEAFPPETMLEPRTAVEAFIQGAWSKGEVVCRLENSDRYLVKVGSKKRMAMAQPETMELKELRPPSNTSMRRKEDKLSLNEVSHHQLTAVVPLSCEPISAENGYSTSIPNNSIPLIGDNPVHKDILPNIALPLNKMGNINAIVPFKGNHDVPDNVSGQTNRRSTRKVKVITHRRKTGFKKRYSQPRSLNVTVVQEDVMLPFNSLLESVVKKSCIADSAASYEERTSILSQIKANVEHAQSCQNRLNEVKSDKTKHLEEKDAAEAQMLNMDTSISQVNSSIEENDRVLAELEQKVWYHRLKGQEMEKVLEHKHSERERLNEVCKRIQEACDDDDRRHASIMDELQLQPFKA